jgi:hypothetical protein
MDRRRHGTAGEEVPSRAMVCLSPELPPQRGRHHSFGRCLGTTVPGIRVVKSRKCRPFRYISCAVCWIDHLTYGDRLRATMGLASAREAQLHVLGDAQGYLRGQAGDLVFRKAGRVRGDAVSPGLQRPDRRESRCIGCRAPVHSRGKLMDGDLRLRINGSGRPWMLERS